MKEVIKREKEQESVVYSDSLDVGKIYGGESKSKGGNKFLFRRLENGNYIACTFEELVKCEYENFAGMTLRDSIDRFIESNWPVYEFKNSGEALQWMAKKD